jgi:hypothetical protein
MHDGYGQRPLGWPSRSGIDDMSIADTSEIKVLVCWPTGSQSAIAKKEGSEHALRLFWMSHGDFPTRLFLREKLSTMGPSAALASMDHEFFDSLFE